MGDTSKTRLEIGDHPTGARGTWTWTADTEIFLLFSLQVTWFCRNSQTWNGAVQIWTK